MNFEINGANYGALPITSIDPITEVKAEEISKITHIQSLSEVGISEAAKTLFLWDLDDTVFDFPYMLGSKSWRSYIGPATKKIDDSKDWHDILSYHLIKNYPVKTVETKTAKFIKKLQEKGYIVCGFTSRERNRWYDMPQDGVDAMTNKQLNSVGIDFNNNALENTYPHLKFNSEYSEGTFFCNIEPKGKFLTHALKVAQERPSKVVFIDDKINQVKSVALALTTLGIANESYCYLATNAKPEAFKPIIANIQLYHYLKSKEILSDDAASLLAKENPLNDEDFYLRAILEIAKDIIPNMTQKDEYTQVNSKV